MKKIKFDKIRQSGGASRWRVCYQRGLPRLVFFTLWQYCSQITKVKGFQFISTELVSLWKQVDVAEVCLLNL